MESPRSSGRHFFVIVHSANEKHKTSHSDFVDGKFYGSLASANAALAILTHPSACLQALARPSPASRSASTSSTSTSSASDNETDSNSSSGGVSSHASTVATATDGRCVCHLPSGEKFEVREIATRSLCGSMTWWFADGEDDAMS